MIAVGREYWKTYLPARYQVLLEAGELEQALATAVERTLEAMQCLRNGGYSQWEAWEATRENHLLLALEPASGSGRRDGQCPKGSNSPAPQAQARPHPMASRHPSRARRAILETQRLIFLKIA